MLKIISLKDFTFDIMFNITQRSILFTILDGSIHFTVYFEYAEMIKFESTSISPMHNVIYRITTACITTVEIVFSLYLDGNNEF